MTNRRRDWVKLADKKELQPGQRRETIVNVPPPELDLFPPWYLVLTAPRAEARAAKALADAGCQVFWPHRSHRIEYGGKRKPLEFLSSTFPGYVLASGEPMRRFNQTRLADDRKTILTVDCGGISSIHDLDGVTGVVSNDGKWVSLPKTRKDCESGKEIVGTVEAIIAIQSDDKPLKKEATASETYPPGTIRAGGQVLICSGPFMGFMATLVESVGTDKARVVIDSFGRGVPLEIATKFLEAA